MSLARFREQILETLVELGELNEDRKQALLASPDSNISFAEIEMDSLTALDLCVNLEEASGKVVEPADLVENPTLNDLASFLDSQAPSQS